MSGIRPTEPIDRKDLDTLKRSLDRRRRDHIRVLAILVVLSHGTD